MKALTIRVTLKDGLLGTLPADPDIHRKYVAAKAADHLDPVEAALADRKADEEVDAVALAEEVFEKGMTVFARNATGAPIIWDYQIKGFFKEACSALKKLNPGTASGKLKAFKKLIDTGVFVYPREIELHMPDEEWVDTLQRPLRADTAQGPRVTLASSEIAPAGTQFECSVTYPDELEDAVVEWLKYGRVHGIGQWRNSGKGRFAYVEIERADLTDLDALVTFADAHE